MRAASGAPAGRATADPGTWRAVRQVRQRARDRVRRMDHWIGGAPTCEVVGAAYVAVGVPSMLFLAFPWNAPDLLLPCSWFGVMAVAGALLVTVARWRR